MARRRRLLAKSVGALLAVALLSPVVSTALAAPAHADPASEETSFLDLTNQLRVSHGLNPLATNSELLSVARRWSANMAAAGGISHNMNLPHDVSLNWAKLGENVGVGSTVDSIQTAFINSPHHYENLVDPVFNYVGIGVVDSGGRIWVTVDFMQYGSQPPAAPAPAPRTTAPRTTSVPRRAPVPQAAPVTAPPAPAPAPAPVAPVEPPVPSPALILALAQVRDLDTGH
jgi:hypothetical protein